MSRSQERKCCYNRWSEPILRRRYSMHLIPTSEEDTSSVRRSRSSSPLLNSLRQTVTQLDETGGCCACHLGHCGKGRMSRSRSTNINNSKILKQQKSSELQQMRESLEIQLVGSQVEEALAGDKEAALIQHLELSANVLEALIQHVSSLQISHMSAQRIVHIAHQLVLPNSSATMEYASSLSSDLPTRIRQAESCKENRLRLLNEVAENCSKNIMVSKKLQSLIDDHRTKKEDFVIAARNFKNLLQNSKLTISQMDKLQWQYQAIMDDYKKNRRMLDFELPKIIKTRLGAIRQGFTMIATFYQDLEYSKHISDLVKILGQTLSQEESETNNNNRRHDDVNEESVYEKCQVKHEMCQKCKVNRIEKK